MRGRMNYRVYYYVGNDPDPRSFFVNARSAEEVREALVNAYGDDADDYEVSDRPISLTFFSPGIRQMWVANGRFVEEDDE